MDKFKFIRFILVTLILVQFCHGDGEVNGDTITLSNGQPAVRDDDLVLSQEQNDWLFGTGDNDRSDNRTKRAGIELRRGISFWPNGVIPYVIDKRFFDQYEMQEIRAAMDVWEQATCIKFIPATTNDRQWVHIQDTQSGCYSLLGNAAKYKPGGQPLSLQNPGCRDFGTYLHELGHSIGLVHEHQLPTRDAFVHYFQTNIDPSNVSQLKKYDYNIINTFDTPYDLGSIMHYDTYSYSIDDITPTLGVDNPWLAQHIGASNSVLVSFGDARTVNRLYKCAASCGPAMLTRRPCPAPGYVNKNCECMTPQSYHKTFCKDSEGYEAFCNNIVPAGNCDVRNIEHHKHCSKSCGFCPRFLPGESAIGPKQMMAGKACVDRYHNPAMCKQWSQFCSSSSWMHRYCRLTCGACASKIGDCPNLAPDSICDHYFKRGYCTRVGHKRHNFVLSKCQDSCDKCGYVREDESCRNNIDDKQCRIQASERMCEKNPLQMFLQCPSTCNRCYWNRGQCANKMGDKVCVNAALQNLCVAQGNDNVSRGCQKICDTC